MMMKIVARLPPWLCGLLCLLLLLPSTGGLECLCSDCEEKLCHTEGACFTQIQKLNSVRVRGCVASVKVAEICIDKSDSGIVCCYDDKCNNWSSAQNRQIRASTDGDHSGSQNMDTGGTSSASNTLHSVAIVAGAVCTFFMITAVSLSLSLFYCYCCRDRRDGRTGDVECGDSPSPVNSLGPVAFQPQGISLQQLSDSSSHPLSSLQQRHIVQHTTLEKNLEKGRFCDTYTGVWRRDKVLVKVFSDKAERIWFAESKIHQFPHMRHANIHGFYATDNVPSSPDCYTQHLILEYHRRGSLYEYLQTTVLHVSRVLVFAMSIADGLSFLHSEFSDQYGKKPAIVHRNLTSESIYVKANDTCCISDFSLAVTGDSCIETELKTRPHADPRYMAPEFLADPSAQNNMESLKKGDMYSYGLVLWEIARRCTVLGMVEDVCLPYSSLLQSSPVKMEEIRELVVSRDLRPPVPDQWNRDENMRIILRTITECWHGNSTVRLSPLRVKKTLWKLSQQIQPKAYDKNGKLLSIDRVQTTAEMV